MSQGNSRRRGQAAARRQLHTACLVGLMVLGGAESAQAQGTVAPQTYSIQAGSLENALNQLSRQSRVQIVFPPEVVAGKQAVALSGILTWRQALERLLQGSGLEYGQVDDSTVVIKRAEGSAASNTRATTPVAPSAGREDAPITDSTRRVAVTGSRIRDGAMPSPIITIDAGQIAEEGFTDLGEVIRSIPQSFAGGQNPGVLMGNVTGGGLQNQNVTGGSGLNLRGLGPDASLTLLNGRRMSYGGFVQAVDISAIPVEAVERIEIIADGASAIYGSDAVGGVGNVILRHDFEGVALGARYGAASDGGLMTREYSGTVGATWESGSLIATYKDASTDPIYARQRGYTNHLPEPTAIYPGSDLRSHLLSVRQSYGDHVEFRLDALRTEREQLYYYYFNSPNIYNKLTPETTSTFMSPSLEFFLSNDWTLSLGGAWGEDEHRDLTQRLDASSSTLVQNSRRCFCNRSRAYEIGAEGPLFRMSGGEARFAIGTGYRTNEYFQSDLTTGVRSIQGDEATHFAYAELNIPIIGVKPGGSNWERLVTTAALRREDYDSFGSVTTPKIGVIWRPSGNFTLKSSWGKSFKAPTLHQRFSTSWAQVVLPASFGGSGYAPDETVVAIGGGNPDLKPERAETWSASIAFHPEYIPGLEAELTSFYIDYSDRAVQPIGSYPESLRDPIYAEYVVYSPSPEMVVADVAATNVFIDTAGGIYDPDKVFAIVYAKFVNATRQKIKGIDLSGSYRFQLGRGQLTIRGASSWLDSTQQTAGMPIAYNLAGTLHNPARLNGRIGAVWNQGGFSSAAFANYASGVRSRSDGVKSASFTTFDATLRYDTRDRGDAWSGLQFALTANNLLNRSPPLYMPAAADYVAPYDSTNYSAIGRYLSLSVSKHW